MLDLPETRPSILLAIRDADDVQAWTRFQQVYGQLIFAMARRHGFQDADAADIHQEVMLRVSGSIQRFEMQRSRARFRTWLHSIVRNVMIDVHRKHGRVPPTVSTSQMHDSIGEQTDEDLDREIDQTYQREVFRWAARQVRKSFRPVSWEAFWRTAVLGEDVRRVAETLKRSTASIYTARSRVMAKLQEMVATFDPELTPGEISLVDSQDASLRLPSESLASESLPNDSLPKESTTGTDEPLSECHNDGPAS